MKKQFLILTAILMASFMGAQTTNNLIQVNDKNYDYTEKSSNIKQTGHYVDIGGLLVRTGIWKLYVNGKKTTVAKYSNDELVWLKNDKGTFEKREILIMQLRNKVDKLENDVVLNNKGGN